MNTAHIGKGLAVYLVDAAVYNFGDVGELKIYCSDRKDYIELTDVDTAVAMANHLIEVMVAGVSWRDEFAGVTSAVVTEDDFKSAFGDEKANIFHPVTVLKLAREFMDTFDSEHEHTKAGVRYILNLLERRAIASLPGYSEVPVCGPYKEVGGELIK